MKIVGFAISKDELWYSVLEGDNKSIFKAKAILQI